MKTLMTLAILAMTPVMAFADTTKDDIKKLAKAGLSDDIILAFIKANGPVAKLSSDDIIELKGVGASDKVIQALLAPKAEPVVATAPAPQPVLPQQPAVALKEFNGAQNPYTTERQVVVEKQVYVEPVYVQSYSPTYYSTSSYCRSHCRYDRCSVSTYSYYPSYSTYRVPTYYTPRVYYSGSNCHPSTYYYGGYSTYRRSSSHKSGWSFGVGVKW